MPEFTAKTRNYYNQLVGYEVTEIVLLEKESEGDDIPQIVLILKNKKGDELLASVLADPEGNGVGHLEIVRMKDE